MAVLDTGKFMDAVCRMLREGADCVPIPVQGDSMRPFLRTGDFAYMESLHAPVKKGDIVLFQRPNGRYVLHRVYKILPGNRYLLLGDSQLVPEPVEGERLRAKARYVTCRGHREEPGKPRWWFFANPWRWLAPWRRQISKMIKILRK